MRAAAVAFSVFVGACLSTIRVAAAPAAPSAASADTLTVYHRWSSASEVTALNGLIDLFKTKYPGVTVKPVLIARRSGSTYVTLKGASGPDAVLMHAGYSVRPFFDAKMVTPVDDIWASEKLAETIPSGLRWMRQSDGRYYSVPINVHRTNVVWYNKSLLGKHGIDASTLTTWAKLFKAADTLRAAGVAAPFQLGEAWTIAHVFECIIASLGLPAYEDWIAGKVRAADDPRMTEAVAVMKQYFAYVNKDHESVGWDAALARVIKGESAFYTMGDWADGEFRQAGLRYGVDYGAMPVPGTEKLYGATIDAFHRSQGTRSSTNVDRWLRLIASREGQDVFNRLKGSIPARTDPDVTKYGPYQKWAIAEFKATTSYPTFGTVTPEAYQQSINRILTALSKDLDVRKAAEALVAAAAVLGEGPDRAPIK